MKAKVFPALVGLAFFRRCSDGSLVIAAHHPAWSLTWSWVLAWRGGMVGKFFACWRTNEYARGWYGHIKLGRLTFSKQPTMRRDGKDWRGVL